MVIRSDRVRTLLAERGLSQSDLARQIGVTQGAIAKIVSNNPGGSSKLHLIARALGTTPGYLTGETDDPDAGAIPLPTPERLAEQLDMVPIEQIDLAYGLGETVGDVEVQSEVLHFPRAWVETITRAPRGQLTFARGRGDSMEPTIHHDDLVLIDRSQKAPTEQDAIWALTVGQLAMVKRLRFRPEKVLVLSDNDAVPADEVPADDVNIVGRVVFVGRRT